MDTNITLTDKAKEKISELLNNKNDEPFVGLRISVSTSGCGGYAYQLEWAYDLEVEDKVIKIDDDISILIPEKWSFVFEGVELDYKREGLNEGFDFTNPNEKGRCGCGESFNM